MKKFSVILFCVLISSFLTACGEKNEVSLPNKKEGLQLAENSSWKAELSWDQLPRYSNEEFLEMRGVIRFTDENGSVPATIESVSLVADMPQHSHGTGNIQPIVSPMADDSSKYKFKNLYFTMTGPWRIKVAGIVNGKADAWYTSVEVGQ